MLDVGRWILSEDWPGLALLLEEAPGGQTPQSCILSCFFLLQVDMAGRSHKITIIVLYLWGR